MSGETPIIERVGRAAVLISLVAALTAASAFAAGPPATLKAKVAGSTVVITNGSSQTFHGYFINSTDSPKITGASDKSCKLGTSPWSAKGKKHVDYWADCSGTIGAHKTIAIQLKLSGRGTIFVWAKVGKTQYKIGQGG
jgi:hypothetical protein